MRLLGLDFETTGLDTAQDRVTEIGLCLWDAPKKRPITTYSIFLHDKQMEERFTPETVDMMERLCGITPELLREFGQDPAKNFAWMADYCRNHGVDYIVAHNGENFDKPFLEKELTRHSVIGSHLRETPWLDTKQDIPHPTPPDSNKLKHLALDAGFINPFAHRAVFDVLTMMRVLSNYPLDEVIAYSKVPFVTVRAVVSYDDRELAKKERYSWEKIGEKTYPKCWVKRIKADKLAEEQAKCKFQVVRLE
jgi:DNA polymerase III alpha subunit (gram-positive type)